MPIAGQYQLGYEGGLVQFHGQKVEERPLQPGESLDLGADEVIGGVIKVSVWSLDFQNPAETTLVGGHIRQPSAFDNPIDPDDPTSGWGSVRDDWHCVTASVELFGPDGGVPAKSWTTKGGVQTKPANQWRHDAGPINPDSRIALPWRLRVTNTSSTVAQVTVLLTYARDQHPVGTTVIPLRVLNHAFDVTLSAVMPQIVVSDHKLHLTFGEELGQTLGLEDGPFGEHSQSFEVPVLDFRGYIQPIDIGVCAGTDVLTAVRSRLDPDDDETRIEDWERRVQPDDVALRLSFYASDIDILATGARFNIATVKDSSIDVFVDLSADGGICENGHVFAAAPLNITGALGSEEVEELAEEKLNDSIAPAIKAQIPIIYRYFAEVLAKLSAFEGSIPAIFLSASAGPDGVAVRWTHDPADLRATVPGMAEAEEESGHDHGHDEAEVGGGVIHLPRRPRGLDAGSEAPEPGGMSPTTTPVDTGGYGELPADFEVGDPQTVAWLDRIQTMVFIMMENRSFDHVLGHLQQLHGADKYHGITGAEENEIVEAGITKKVKITRASQVVRWPVTQILDEPHHSTEHVAKQVADGAMSGFAADMDGNPQIALTYYTGDELPVTYDLAANFMVLDNWFSTYAGGTYPNRWATLGGATPNLENSRFDDPRLGFMRDRTIFESLSSAGIGWKYFESNLSIIRMYGNYRLDDQHVLPFSDPDDPEGFERTAKDGRLPEVVFVEPRFTGIPPLRRASDDHPPADMAEGQAFLDTVIRALRASPQWPEMLVVITYDEHGGFYDHVAPPGTSHGPAEWHGKIPPLHPEGPDFMGPRVPTLVVSPFVNPGSVSHALFDHTSILKTILVRHRAHFQRYEFELYGKRVAMINHLGAILDRDSARTDAPTVPTNVIAREVPSGETPLEAVAVQPDRRPLQLPPNGDPTDFRVGLARAFAPKPRTPR